MKKFLLDFYENNTFEKLAKRDDRKAQEEYDEILYEGMAGNLG